MNQDDEGHLMASPRGGRFLPGLVVLFVGSG
jgi:hypothetical protein